MSVPPFAASDRAASPVRAAPRASAEPWLADQGDGTYRNPVLFSDYSDPDVIRVGADFYLIASSFHCAPGLPVLHSRDLVNWTLLSHVYAAQPPLDHFSVPRPGQGAWAPALRHHDGLFRVYYPDPDFGIYVATAADPAGPWSPPRRILAGRGLIDPCPFWDDDGEGFLLHGWAKSRSGINNLLTLHRLGRDGAAVEDPGEVVIDANRLPDWHTLEGPKLYKRRGWYYVFAPAGGVKQGYQAVFRARRLPGPYEPRIVLDQGATAINGPHQGAWVETAEGEDWFLHFQDRGAFGRVVHLQPMRWSEDGWPMIGVDPTGRGRGQPVPVHAKPRAGAGEPRTAPATSDEFSAAVPGRQWQWQANPRPEWAAIVAVPGGRSRLRLACVRTTAGSNHGRSGHLFLQKFSGPEFVATTSLDFSSAQPGDTAGLIVFGDDYAWLGLERAAQGWRVTLRHCARAMEEGSEREEAGVVVCAPVVGLRVSVDPAARCRFFWSGDGRTFAELGGVFTAVAGRWVGAKVGLFASAAPGTGPAGSAEFDWFRVARP